MWHCSKHHCPRRKWKQHVDVDSFTLAATPWNGLWLYILVIPDWRFLAGVFSVLTICTISIFQANTRRAGGSLGAPRNNLRLYPLRIIEQIGNEQLLPVTMTRFNFICTDTGSDSICMLRLPARLISSPIPAFNISWQTELLSLFMDSTNRQACRTRQVSINYSRGPLLACPLGWRRPAPPNPFFF